MAKMAWHEHQQMKAIDQCNELSLQLELGSFQFTGTERIWSLFLGWRTDVEVEVTGSGFLVLDLVLLPWLRKLAISV